MVLHGPGLGGVSLVEGPYPVMLIICTFFIGLSLAVTPCMFLLPFLKPEPIYIIMHFIHFPFINFAWIVVLAQ